MEGDTSKTSQNPDHSYYMIVQNDAQPTQFQFVSDAAAEFGNSFNSVIQEEVIFEVRQPLKEATVPEDNKSELMTIAQPNFDFTSAELLQGAATQDGKQMYEPPENRSFEAELKERLNKDFVSVEVLLDDPDLGANISESASEQASASVQDQPVPTEVRPTVLLAPRAEIENKEQTMPRKPAGKEADLVKLASSEGDVTVPGRTFTARNVTSSVTTLTGEKMHLCTECNLGFTDRIDLRDHVSEVHGQTMEMFPCDVCGKKFLSKANKKRHEMQHSEDNPHKCNACGKVFCDRRDLLRHENVHSEARPFECELCGQKFRQQAHLTSHEAKVHQKEKSFECSVCRMSFTSKNALTVHVATHTGKAPLQCHLCNTKKVFSRRSNLNRHLFLHTGERKHLCSHCGKAFANSTDLKKHVERVHIRQGRYRCTMCFKSYCSLADYKRHIMSHTGEKPFACTLCPKAFNHKGSLEKHYMIHRDERPHKCNLCEKAFRFSRDLRNHQVVHTGERVRCEFCSKTFSIAASLVKHRRTHTGPQLFPCQVCGDTFLSRELLMKHGLKHADVPQQLQRNVELTAPTPDIQGQPSTDGGLAEKIISGGLPTDNTAKPMEPEVPNPTIEQQLNSVQRNEIQPVVPHSTAQPAIASNQIVLLQNEAVTPRMIVPNTLKNQANQLFIVESHQEAQEQEEQTPAPNVMNNQDAPVMNNDETAEDVVQSAPKQQEDSSGPQSLFASGEIPNQEAEENYEIVQEEMLQPAQESATTANSVVLQQGDTDQIFIIQTTPEPQQQSVVGPEGQIQSIVTTGGPDVLNQINLGQILKQVLSQTTQVTTPAQATDQPVTAAEAPQQKSSAPDKPVVQNDSAQSNNSPPAGGINKDLLYKRTKDKWLQCNICSMKFKYKVLMEIHLRRHTGERPFKCNQCNKSFRRKYSLEFHMLDHSGERPHKCTMCQMAFKRKDYLKLHMYSHSKEGFPYKCQVCGKAFSYESLLRQHMRTHTGERPFECSECKKKFLRKDLLTLHARSHSKDPPEFECEICGRLFDLKRNLRKHLLTHGPKLFECVCGKSYGRKHLLNNHQKNECTQCHLQKPENTPQAAGTTEEDDGSGPHICDLCGEAFSTSYNKLRHLYTHAGQHFHKCGLCNETFTSDAEIQNHMESHRNPFECDLCGRVFRVKTKLDEHKVEHENE